MQKPSTLKVSLNNDIRRLSFNAKDYQELHKQIAELFSIEIGNFSLKYKDDEGDMITIGTNEEFKESLNCCQQNILRIFVTLKEQKKCNNRRNHRKMKSPRKQEKIPQIQIPTLNPFQLFAPLCQNVLQGGNLDNVLENLLNSNQCKLEHNHICDGCDSQISGTRYHCINCQDFDFCTICFNEKIKTHDPNHQFQPITAIEALKTAIQNNEEIEAFFMPGNATDPSPKKIHNAICDRCDEKIVGIRWKCFDCQDFDFCNACYVFANGKESFKLHDKSHTFGKIEDPQTTLSFQVEKEKYMHNQRLEKERIEKETLEKERLEKERLEKERFEKERIEKETTKNQESENNIVYTFEQKLNDLNIMGFIDRKRNIQILVKNQGDMIKSLEDLLKN